MPRKLAVVVNGGRNYGKLVRERQHVYAALDKARPEIVLHGGATGADSIAREWCIERGVWQVEYPADWSLGKVAGPKRNAIMVDDLLKYKDDGYRLGVISFPGGTGTASCNAIATRRGLKIWMPPIAIADAPVTFTRVPLIDSASLQEGALATL